MLDQKTKCCPMPKAEGNILSEGPTYHMMPEYPVNDCFVHHHICPRHPGCQQQIDTTWDKLVSDKVDSERIDLLVTSSAS